MKVLSAVTLALILVAQPATANEPERLCVIPINCLPRPPHRPIDPPGLTVPHGNPNTTAPPTTPPPTTRPPGTTQPRPTTTRPRPPGTTVPRPPGTTQPHNEPPSGTTTTTTLYAPGGILVPTR